jgi:hypothetical protein
MKLQATMLILAFCLGMGCGGELEDTEMPAAPAALKSVDTGAKPAPSGATSVAYDNPDDPGRGQWQCDDQYRTCVVACGFNPTKATQKCGKKCDDQWLSCLSIEMQ